MINLANDDVHGYDQIYRWGPDYDCSSAIITAWQQAGVPVKSCGATYTGNMKKAFLSCGFADVTGKVNLSNGAGIKYGDVLLNEANHTAMSLGDGRIVQASINELGGITGGASGDQTGDEIGVRTYYNYPWDCVLRYAETDKEAALTWRAIGTATSTANQVNVYAEPGIGILGILNYGNRFEVDGRKSGVWIHVKVANIGVGYVHQNYVKYDDGSIGKAWRATGTATSTVNQLNVRAAPNGTIIGTLNYGNRFEVDGTKSGTWVRVKVARIGIGYVHQDYVKYD